MPLRKEDKAGGPEHIFGVPSSRGTGIHEVIKWKSGAWSCNCTDWIIRRAKSGDHTERTGDHCTHVKACIEKRFKPSGVVYAVPSAPAAQPGRRAEVAFGEDAI